MKASPTKVFLSFTGLLHGAYAAWVNLTLGDYTLKRSGCSSAIANIEKALPKVKVEDIMDDLNYVNPAASPSVENLVASAYKWEDSADFNDQNTGKWYPQGITTSADAHASGEYEGQRVQLVTWHSDNYDDGKREAKVNFVS